MMDFMLILVQEEKRSPKTAPPVLPSREDFIPSQALIQDSSEELFLVLSWACRIADEGPMPGH